MLPLATQVQLGQYCGLYAAQGRRDSSWGPRGTSLGAYGELTGPFLNNSLLYPTPQNKTKEDVPASRDRPVSSADRMLRPPRP